MDKVLPLLHEYINYAYKSAFEAIDARDEDIVFKTIELSPISILRNAANKYKEEDDEESSSSDDTPIKTKGRVGNWFRFKTTKAELEFKQLVISEIKSLWFQLKTKPRTATINVIQYRSFLKFEFKRYFIWSYEELERYGIIDELEDMRQEMTLDDAILKLKKDINDNSFLIDFEDEFKSFFLYITSSGHLTHFSEQFYWMKNAYELLLKPRIMKLIDENRERIKEEFEV